MTQPLSRRALVGALLAAPLPLAAAPELAPADLRVLPETGPPEPLLDYYLRLAREATVQRQERLEGVRTEADLRGWQETNRARFLECIGGLPGERTPLQPRVIGVLERPGYRIRKIVFESLPEFYVTANLYVPDGGGAPYPAVLAPVGHTPASKAYPEYQRLFIGLVRAGYVVLTWDTIGQGERFQLWDFVFRHRGLTEKSSEHGAVGLRECVLGRNIARYMIWDGLRALDYLCSLPEVDAARIGCTGNSGGGALTTYLAALDPRIRAASAVTWICSLPRKIEARIRDAEGDPEQDVPGLLAAGLDHTEIAGLIAPRPLLIGSALRDFFPIQGTRETFAELRGLYQRIGAAGRVDMVAYDHEHMYSQPLREATTRWFNRWLRGVEGEVREQAATVEKEETLWCTATGQVVSSPGGNRLQDYDAAEARRLTAVLERRRAAPGFATQVKASARTLLGLAPFSGLATDVQETAAAGLRIRKIVLEPEPAIQVPVRILEAGGAGHARSAAATVVYLRDRDGAADPPAFFATLAAGGRTVLVADVRGFGETRSARNVIDTRMYYYHPRDGMDADYAYAGFALGRPILGGRVTDALAVLRLAHALAPSTRIVLMGRGWAGLVALFAAALEPSVARVAAEGFPASYAELAGSEPFAQPASLMLPGALRAFDIADVIGAIAPRPVLLLNPQDAQTRRLPLARAGQAMAPARAAYRNRRADTAFKLAALPTESEIWSALERRA